MKYNYVDRYKLNTIDLAQTTMAVCDMPAGAHPTFVGSQVQFSRQDVINFLWKKAPESVTILLPLPSSSSFHPLEIDSVSSACGLRPNLKALLSHLLEHSPKGYRGYSLSLGWIQLKTVDFKPFRSSRITTSMNFRTHINFFKCSNYFPESLNDRLLSKNTGNSL